MTDPFTILQNLPKAAAIVRSVRAAGKGDPQALQYVKSELPYEAADLWRPGAGQIIRGAVGALKDLANGGIIDGEFREVEQRAPWTGCAKHICRMKSGSIVLLGSPGTGKTKGGLRIAQRIHQRWGYPVEGVNFYDEDRPSWVRPISVSTLIERMEWLNDKLDWYDPDLPDDELYNPENYRINPRWAGRVVAMDESSMTISNKKRYRKAVDDGEDPQKVQAYRFTSREAAKIYLAQSRHVKTVVIYMAQWAGQLPKEIIGLSTVFVKRPVGDEKDTDRQEPFFRNLWMDAEAAFATVRDNPGWPAFPDHRAWAFVRCPEYNAGRGYRGLIPLHLPEDPIPYTEEIEDDEEDDEE